MFGFDTYKRMTLGLLLAAVPGFVAGCAKFENDLAKVPVSFATYSSRVMESKAGSGYVAPGGDFAPGAEIAVFGYHHDASDWDTDQASGSNIPDFMYNQLLTKQDDGSWVYSPVKYWPNEYGANAASSAIDRLSFWGYYPRGASGLDLYKPGTTTSFDNGTSGVPKVAFTQSEDPDEMTDLMFCGPLKDLYKTQGHVVGSDEKHYGYISDGEVLLTFKHALSLVEFQLAEGTGAELNLLRLTNIKKSGTVEDPSSLPIEWSNVGSEYTLERANIDIHDATILRLLAIPQTISADATFTLNYNITFESSDPTHPDPIVYTGDSFSVKLFKKTGPVAEQYGVTAWEPGKHYIYKIAAGLDRIEFEEIVESADDWSVGNSNISVPD